MLCYQHYRKMKKHSNRTTHKEIAIEPLIKKFLKTKPARSLIPKEYENVWCFGNSVRPKACSHQVVCQSPRPMVKLGMTSRSECFSTFCKQHASYLSCNNKTQ